MSELSKHDALLHKSYIKILLVPGLDMCRSILSITDRTVAVGTGGDTEVGGRGLTKFEKGG